MTASLCTLIMTMIHSYIQYMSQNITSAMTKKVKMSGPFQLNITLYYFVQPSLNQF